MFTAKTYKWEKMRVKPQRPTSLWRHNMKRFFVFLFIVPLFLNFMIAADDIYKTVERIKVDVDQPFSSFYSFRKLPDGFVLLLMESQANYGTPILVKIDKNGRFQKNYKEWGLLRLIFQS